MQQFSMGPNLTAINKCDWRLRIDRGGDILVWSRVKARWGT
uniref:Uncharacterized protein n=1 Tax=Arundo donax TaxID=35708 RepID=A0A0A8Y6C4_ARUDO